MLLHQSFSLLQSKFWSRVSCLHAKHFMYGNFLVHVWSQCRGLNKKTLYIGSLGVKLTLTSLGVTK
jgi:hypothetical protein